MGDENEYDKTLGVDMSLDEARERFARATVDDLDISQSPTVAVEEGELEFLSFRGGHFRRVCHNDEWWYSIVDVVGAVVGTGRASKYWTDLRTKLIDEEGFFELSAKIGKLPLPGADGKNRPAEVATTETLLRIIQSMSTPEAERIKRWLARVGYERIQEWQDPEIAIKRAIVTYQVQGRSDDWIEKRIRTIVARKELTNEWKNRGLKEGYEFATLTNVISQETFGLPVERHKTLKALTRSHNLRDHMTDLELILTMLGETSTKEIAVQRDAQGYAENFHAARAGGSIAGTARKQIEGETGKRIASERNFLGNANRISNPESLSTPKRLTEKEGG